jgi:hypothetical protein
MTPFHDHGTIGRYYAGCRCDECREAKRVRVAVNRAKVREGGFVNATHGSGSAYDAGCRCPMCGGYRRRKVQRETANSPTKGPAGPCEVCGRILALVGGRYLIVHGPRAARCPGSHLPAVRRSAA